jgi:hypothetical protein
LSKPKQPGIFIRNNPAAPQLCPELAKEIGLNESILLLQLEYWLTRHGEVRDDGHMWIRKPVREIQETFSFWSIGTINTIIDSLVRKEYVMGAGLDKARGRSGRWLRLCLEKLSSLKSIRVCSESEQSMFRNTPDHVQDLNNRPYIVLKNKDIPAVADTPPGYKQPRRTKTLIPEEFCVSPAMRNWAHGIGLDDDRVDNGTERYVRHSRKTEKRLYPEHWPTDWEEWMLKELQFANTGNRNGNNGHGGVVNDQPMKTLKERMGI